MSESEMQAELERLRAENVQLRNKDKGGLTLKVSEKGGLPVRYGSVSSDALQRAVAAHLGQRSRHRSVHPRKRREVESQGVGN